jgi:hypothetical protein
MYIKNNFTDIIENEHPQTPLYPQQQNNLIGMRN